MPPKLTPTIDQLNAANDLLEYDHGLLWAKPGTGKTLTALIVAQRLREDGLHKVLVVSPKIALTMWAESFHTQWGEAPWVLRSSRSAEWGKLNENNLVITTFTIAASAAPMEALRKWVHEDTVVIIDESHYCKSPDSKRSLAILAPPTRRAVITGPDGEKHEGQVSETGHPPGFATRAGYVLQMTGTPMTRYPDDLWMQLAYVRANVLDAYKVRTYRQFSTEFCTFKNLRTGRTTRRVTAGAKNEGRLKKLIDDCKPVRLSSDHLPELVSRPVEVEIPVKFEKIKVNDEEVLREISNSDTPMAKRFRELGVEKAKAALPYIIETYVGKPVLIGALHMDVINTLKAGLKQHGKVRVVRGSTSQKQRDEIAELFNKGEVDFLVGQVKAMGVSWNLQEACSDVLLVEQLPSPSDVDQFVARVARGGQKQRVRADELVCDDDLDRALRNIRATKRKIEGSLGL